MMLYHRILNIVPCAIYSKTFLFIHSIFFASAKPKLSIYPPLPPWQLQLRSLGVCFVD